jgi:[ribosomal protein S18]-alanine N-acetyltransferase
MTAQELARLHAECFTQPPPWPASAFEGFLGAPGVQLIARAHGFLLGRVIMDEAEILTLAVSPGARRQGLGGALLAEFLHAAQARGALHAFLEVAADNTAARALYAQAGFVEAGIRRGYYASASGCPAIDALTLCKAL